MLRVNIKELIICDVVIVGMFVFGLAYSLTHLNNNQDESIANFIIEASSQPDDNRITLGLRVSLKII